MTEAEYKNERITWLEKLFKIKKPKFFPRCVRARLKGLARLEEAYNGRDFEEAYKEIHDDFYSRFVCDEIHGK
ncbi:hypothetical protein [Bacteroides pyogenes]|uniref:hypothetical protein n=1 Tax=Bacteroides pyogenes TaxID=310300 RepID=UPI002FDA85C6